MTTKLPWFPLYAKDFLTGVAGLTHEEVGIYALLLCHQWDRGFVPGDPQVAARMVGCEASSYAGHWSALSDKFKGGEDGNFRNERLEEERRAGAILHKKRVLAGRRGAQARLKPGSSPATGPATHNHNHNHKKISPPTPLGVDAEFEVFWKAYPRGIRGKAGKGAALKAWQKIKPSAELQAKMLAALGVQAKSEQWTRDRGQYIPNPATWLNETRWLDEVQPADRGGVRLF